MHTFSQDTNGSSLSNGSDATEKNSSCYCTHTSSPPSGKKTEAQDANILNSRAKRKPADFNQDRYIVLPIVKRCHFDH